MSYYKIRTYSRKKPCFYDKSSVGEGFTKKPGLMLLMGKSSFLEMGEYNRI
jgi:hypothetical protein